MENEILEKYDKIRAEYSQLPGFDELNQEFEIESIEAKTLLLRSIRRKILDKLEGYIEIFEQVLQGDTSLRNMHEASQFDDSDKEKLFSLFKNMMITYRRGTIAALSAKPEEDAEFISQAYESWNAFKPLIHEHLTKIKEGWEKETTQKEATEYFG